MNSDSDSNTQSDAKPADEQRTELLQFALDEAIMKFCDVVFSPQRNTDIYRTLLALGYDEEDLISSRSLSIHLYLRRKHEPPRVSRRLLHLRMEPR